MRITMVSGSTCFAILRTSRPPILGILRSVITTSMDVVLRIRSAASPESAVTTSYPLGLRISWYDKRTLRSSSTRRMVSAMFGRSHPAGWRFYGAREITTMEVSIATHHPLPALVHLRVAGLVGGPGHDGAKTQTR